jgi:dipeptidyl aminopeptidase/acylaminoacyl peptidase
MRFILILLFACTVTVALTQGRLTPELLWEIDRLGSPVASPDGKYLAYTLSDYNWRENKGRTDIYLVPTKGGTPQKLTSEMAGSSWQPEWRPDGKYLACISTNAGEPQMFEINVSVPGDFRQVTNQEGGITAFHYAKNMTKVVYAAQVRLGSTTVDRYPDLPLTTGRIIDDLMYRHWDEWDDKSFSHIFYQEYRDESPMGPHFDIMTGEPYDAPTMPFGGSDEFAISPDGSRIVYTCKKSTGLEYAKSTNTDIYMLDLATGDFRNLSLDNPGYDRSPVFSSDGTKLAWNRMSTPGYESDKNTIVVYDIIGMMVTDVLKEHDISASEVTWAQKDERLYFIAGKNATYHLFSYDLIKSKLEQVTKGRCDFSTYTLAGNSAFALRSTMQEPNALYEINIKKGSYAPFINPNAQILSNLQKSSVRKHWVKTSTGEQMLTWVILPPGFDSTRQYPTLLYCQGGPQSAISQYYSYRWNFELMAANDYIIIAPNRHGVPTFGQEYNLQISGDWGGQAMRDYNTALAFATKLPYVDAKNLGCVGASYGGYSVYWLAGHNDGRFKCFVAHCGLFNLNSWYASTEELFFADFDLQGAPWDGKARLKYEAFNPANFVKNWDAPILVIHGEKDFRVPVGEGMQAFNSAKLLGLQARFLYYPDEGHWVLKPQNGILWHREYFRWLDEHLKE